MKVLDAFINQLEVISGFNTDWATEFGKTPKIGDLIQVRKPYRWQVSTGAALVRGPMDDQFATIRVDRHRHIGFDYSKWSEVLEIEEIYNRCFKTSIIQLSNQVDDDACQFAYQNTNNIQGTLGTDPNSLFAAQNQLLTAMAQLKENACQGIEEIRAILGPRQSANSQAYLNQQFNSQPILARQYDTGKLQGAFGFERIRTDQNVYRHTAGTFVGTPLVNDTPVDGYTSIITDGWTSGDTLLTGDVISVASQNNVNPVNRRTTGIAKRLLVLADATADSGGNMTIQVSAGGTDPIRGPGQYQNVDALAANNAAITVWPGTATPTGLTGTQGLAFGPDAFAYVPIMFRSPKGRGADGDTVRDPKTGISLTWATQFQIGPYEDWNRIDIGYGLAPLYPDNEAIRIVGA